MRQAKKLMELHGLSGVDAEFFTLGSAAAEFSVTTPAWVNMLAGAISTAFEVTATHQRNITSGKIVTTIRFIGAEPAPELAQYALDVLMRQGYAAIENFKANRRVAGLRIISNKTNLASSFAKGWAIGITRAVSEFATPLSEEKQKEHADYIRTIGREINGSKKEKSRPRNTEEAKAMVNGITEGEKVNIRHSINSTNRAQLT